MSPTVPKMRSNVHQWWELETLPTPTDCFLCYIFPEIHCYLFKSVGSVKRSPPKVLGEVERSNDLLAECQMTCQKFGFKTDRSYWIYNYYYR